MVKWWASGFAAALGVAPAFAQDGQSGFDRPYWLSRSVIESIGRARLEAMPDRASLSVTFMAVDATAGGASAEAADRARLAEAAMRRRGGESVQISSDLALEVIHRSDEQRADRIANYVARVTLRVDIRDIARAADVRAAALAARPQDAEPLNFYLRETTEIQRRAFGAAAEDAAARARVAAQATGATLGPLLALQEGQGPCLGRWYGPRPGYPNAAPPAPPPPASASQDTGEEIVVTGSRRGERLTLTVEEIQRLQLAADPRPIVLESHVCAVYAAGP